MGFMDRQRRSKQDTMPTKVESSSQGIVHQRFSIYMEEGGEFVHLIWTVCVGELKTCSAGAKIE